MRKSFWIIGGVALGLCSLNIPMQAQTAPLERRYLDLEVGAGYSGVRPDYGQKNFYGPAIFADLNLPFHIGIEGDIHLADFNAPNGFAENTYEIGARYNLQSRWTGRKLVVYPKIMYGRGRFNNVFNNNPTGTFTYNLYTLGGGVEYRAFRHVTWRVGDFEAQRWLNFPGSRVSARQDNGLTPYVITTGLAYNF